MSADTDELNAILTEQRERYPAAVRAAERLLVLAPMFRTALRDMLRAYGETFFQRGEERIHELEHVCDNDRQRFDAAIQAYGRFCLESMRKQAEFLRTGTYACHDFAELYRELYQNDLAVREFYMPALLLSFVFSPNYYEFCDFFEAEFLPRVADARTVVEVGCGHGVYLGRTLLRATQAVGTGVDIAPAALAVARRMLEYYGVAPERCALRLDDLRGRLQCPDASAQAIICCEVLEHLPDPQHGLRELRRVLAPTGMAMISAAVRMESVDHLYVFRTPEEVKTMAAIAGLRLRAERVVPLAKGNLRDRAERERLSADPRVPVGYICVAEAIA